MKGRDRPAEPMSALLLHRVSLRNLPNPEVRASSPNCYRRRGSGPRSLPLVEFLMCDRDRGSSDREARLSRVDVEDLTNAKQVGCLHRQNHVTEGLVFAEMEQVRHDACRPRRWP